MIYLSPQEIVIEKYYEDNYKKNSISYKDLEEEVFSLQYLEEEVNIKGNFTIFDLLSLIRNDIEIFSLIFSTSLGGFNLKYFFEELPTKKEDPDDTYKINYFWENTLIDNDGSKMFSSYPGIDLRNKSNNEPSYSLLFLSLSEYCFYPIELNTNFCIGNFQANKNFTLFDLFKGIFIEMSFLGEPEQRETAYNDIITDFNDR